MAESQQPVPNKGDLVKQSVAGLEIARTAETASTAVAATAKALVAARYQMALMNPRDFDLVRSRILKACERPRFAETVAYSKPMGGRSITGPSIKFADEAVKLFQNINTGHQIILDDDEQRIVEIWATDVETNLTKSTQIIVKKTIERSSVKEGQKTLGQRLNSYGKAVYIVRPTDDELGVKEAALHAKARRNLELQMLPQDIIDEALERAAATLAQRDKEEPDAAKKRMVDAFFAMGVNATELAKHLGHKLDSCSPVELARLRDVYARIKDGDITWHEYTKGKTADPLGGDAPTATEKALKRAKDARERRKNAAPPKPPPAKKSPTAPPTAQGPVSQRMSEAEIDALANGEPPPAVSQPNLPGVTKSGELDMSPEANAMANTLPKVNPKRMEQFVAAVKAKLNLDVNDKASYAGERAALISNIADQYMD